MSDLLPCPFCGGDADLDFWWNENGDGGRGKVICIDCGTEMAGSDHSRPITAAEKAASKSEAVAFWNRRALPAVQPKVKPLDFVYGRAECETGVYVIDSGQSAGGGRWWAWAHNPDESDPFYLWSYGARAESEDSAKAAAQADYEARILSALDPAVQPDAALLEAAPDIMAWYGAYCSGDRYTVTVDGRNVPMDQNGEPTKVGDA